MSSKTARSSAVKEIVKVKQVIPDDELVRLLRIDLASGIYPGQQMSGAVLRMYDALNSSYRASSETAAAELGVVMAVNDALRNQLQDQGRELVLAQSTVETLRKAQADMAEILELNPVLLMTPEERRADCLLAVQGTGNTLAPERNEQETA